MSAGEPSQDGSPASSPAGSPGVDLSPFRAVRYTTPDPIALARLTSPAYDLIDAASRAALERADPYNVVRLILPRRAERAGHDAYTGAARTLAAWRHDGTLAVDAQPALYRYDMTVGDRTTSGIVGLVRLEPPESGAILPHEDTMPGPVADRLALLRATRANFEPIVLGYDGADLLTDTSEAEGSAPPLARLYDDDGVEHTIRAIRDRARIAAIRAELSRRTAVIADGHHRYASYRRYQEERRSTGAAEGPWDRGLAYLVAVGGGGLRTRAIHRVLPTLDLSTAVEAARHVFTVDLVHRNEIEQQPAEELVAGLEHRQFLLTDGTTWYRLRDPDQAAVHRAVGTSRSAAWRDLDVTLAHHLLIGPLWGIPDEEPTVRFGYDVASTVAAVAHGGTALLLPPTPAASVLAVARHRERMPRKSTLFVPKPRTGLLLRCYTDEPPTVAPS